MDGDKEDLSGSAKGGNIRKHKKRSSADKLGDEKKKRRRQETAEQADAPGQAASGSSGTLTWNVFNEATDWI